MVTSVKCPRYGSSGIETQYISFVSVRCWVWHGMAVQIEVLRGLRLWGVTVPTVRDLLTSSSHVEREGFCNARDLTTPPSTVGQHLRVH